MTGNSCRIDGGVSNNDFLVEMLADLINCKVDRPHHVDMASLGAAFLAGLAVGKFKLPQDFIKVTKNVHV